MPRSLLSLAASLGALALLCRARRRALRRELAGVIGSAGLPPTPEGREALAAACRMPGGSVP